MTQQLPLSIIIPAYNEEEIIVSSVNQTLNAAAALVANFEIIIVDDGSQDLTKQLVEGSIANWRNTKLVAKEQNGGFGSAIQTGIQHAGMEYILCVPVDSPMDTDTLAKFLEVAANADVVASYRVKRVGYTPRMRFNSWVYQKLVSAVFGMRLIDYNWIHLYRASIFKTVRFKSRGIFMMAEILIEAHKHGFKIVEVPVEQKQRITGIATSAKLSTIWFVLKEMHQYLLNSR